MTELTAGLVSNQARATWAGGTSWAAATCTTASMTSYTFAWS